MAPLLEALDHVDEVIDIDDNQCFYVRLAAAEALRVLGDRGATLKLIAGMRNGDDDAIARSAIWSLGQLLGERAIRPLIATMLSQDPGNRWEAATNALVAFNRPEIDEQIDALQRWRQERLVAWVKVPFSAELRARRAWEKPLQG